MTTRAVVLHDVRVFARFATIGIVSNALLFALYLVLSVAMGLQPVVAATIGWIVGVTASFLLNRSWTFADSGPRAPTFLRYVTLYSTAYLLNMLLLVLFVGRAGFPHESVQGVLIILSGLLLFLGQRYWVFASRSQA